MKVKFKKLYDDTKLPQFKHIDDACMDCYARLAEDSVSVPAGSRCLISLGFAMEIPSEYEAIIRPRSGLSSKGIDIAIGTIDSNYRGEVKACFINDNKFGNFEIKNGDRICQIAIRKISKFEIEEVSELSNSERGENGFGSTGI